MKESKCNLLFCFENKVHLDGVLHFTDYNCKKIYHSLYQNLYSFETSLRDHLNSIGYNYAAFKEYFSYRIKKEPDNFHYRSQFVLLESERFQKEAQQLRPLQRLDFKDLLYFATSSFHDINSLNNIGLKGYVKADKLCALRNSIMHSKDFVGYNENQPFSFLTFENFFNQVNELKKAFSRLKEVRFPMIQSQKIELNQIKLKHILDMSDKTINEYFNK